MIALENLYNRCAAHGFRPVGQEAAAVAMGFTLAKEENADLCLLQVADRRQMNNDVCKFLHDREMGRAAALSQMYGSVWVVFLRIGGDREEAGAEQYYGQSPYAIYWHMDPESAEVTAAKGQPDDIMGLKAAVSGLFETQEEAAETSAEHHGQQSPGRVEDAAEAGAGAAPGLSSSFCTFILAAANILVLILMYQQGFAQNPMIVAARFGAIIPALIWEAGEYYRLLTAMFIHFGWEHLIFNVGGMLIFGTRIERYYGKAAFLAIYFISGLIASVTSLFLTQGFSAGSSGAVYGLLGAAFIYTRYTKRTMDLINNHVIFIYIIIGLGMGFVLPNIDYFGHIGGLAAGVLTGFAALKLEGNKS
jgi:membrane associated rhomboid family serine protease